MAVVAGIGKGLKASWWVYFVRTRSGTLYTGATLNVKRRYLAHCAGRGARYLRAHPPQALVYRVRLGERGLALRVEAALKRLPKSAKESIVASQPRRVRLLRMIGVEPTKNQGGA